MPQVPFIWHSVKGRTLIAEIRSVVPGTWGGGLTLGGMRELSGVVEKFYVLIEVLLPQLYIYENS